MTRPPGAPSSRSNLPVIALAAYLVLLVALTFLPIGTDASVQYDRVNLTPFATIRPALRHGPGSTVFALLVGNIAAFVPLGILLPAVSARLRSLVVVICIAVVASAAIETGQLAVSSVVGFPYRSTDIDDVILNVGGALIGYTFFAVTKLLGALQPSR